MKKYSDLLPVASFSGIVLLIASFYAFTQENWEFVYYIIVVLILAWVVFVIHKRVHLTQGILWALSIWSLLHMTGGLVPVPESWPIDGDKRVFYSLWLIPNLIKYDHIVHAYGFGVATWLSWQALSTVLHRVKPTFGVLSLCVLAGMGLGATNEIVEFIAVITVPDTNVGGYINTGWDLIANLIGCVVAAFLIASSHKTGKRNVK